MAFDILESIRLDMQNLNAVTVNAVQYDNTRRLKVQLLNGGVTWSVPSNNVKAVVSFKKSDNIGGFYDVTDLGEDAVSYDSDRSIIYIRFDVQVLTTVGNVNVQINFYQNKQRISAFTFHVNVEASVIRSNEVSSNWLFHILSKEIADTLTVATTPQAMTDWLEANITQETGYVIDNTLTVAGAASDAEATGKMVVVSDQNPNRTANKVWVKKTPAEIQIPTMDDIQSIRDEISQLRQLIQSGSSGN